MQSMETVPARKIEWVRAWKALRGLVADSQRTEQVFEITDALAGNSFERSFQRFRRHPDGQRLLAERPSLLETLSDRAVLRALPAGSFGRAYAEFMESGNLTAEGLVEAERMAESHAQKQEADADRQFFGDRVRDMHDLWHVLTGYGMDEAGEAANLAFTQAQIPNKGIGLILAAAAVIGPKDLALSWQRYLLHAWRRGRRAVLLTVVPYEELLGQPLDAVRTLLHVQPANEAHPGGIVVANRGDDPDSAWRRDWEMQRTGPDARDAA
jgi:ubiquinone biosynthesis protein COQ4